MGISTKQARIPPAIDQIEVTLFGPGYGESILIHLGNNKWVVVDSCIDSETKEPAALSYLQSIGVDPAISVVLIIATHWHDDHVRGISKTLLSCPNARFCASAAFSQEEFLSYLFLFDEHNLIAAGSGIKELKKIMAILETRSVSIKAMMNRKVFNLLAHESGHGEECSVWTLSPSDKQFDLFLSSLAELIPEIKTTKYRATELSDHKNHLSVVVWIEVGDISILLGGDLKETIDSETGWSVITESVGRPHGKASIYKVSHHGSINAHSDDIWNKMLSSQSYAILTPYNRGRKKLPATSDVSRILSFTSEGYSTSQILPAKSNVRRSNAVERSIKETVGKIRKLQLRTGMVRLRCTIQESKSAPWSVELSDAACKLEDVHL